MFEGRGCSWGTLRVQGGNIGEPKGALGKIRGITTAPRNRILLGLEIPKFPNDVEKSWSDIVQI